MSGFTEVEANFLFALRCSTHSEVLEFVKGLKCLQLKTIALRTIGLGSCTT